MSQILKGRAGPIENVLSWLTAGVALVAAIILDRNSAPHKWHAAIMWTVLAFFGVLLWGREKWRAVSFWIFWAVCLVLHIVAMWAIFGAVLPRLALGTIYVIPIAFIESVLLAALFFIIERKVRNHSDQFPVSRSENQ